MTRAAEPVWRRAALPVLSALVALAVLAPVLRRGYVLSYDMIFTPDPPLLGGTVGLSSALPRAVPADAVVALAALFLPGDLIQKLFLGGALFFAALGAGRLVPAGTVGARLVAATMYAWSAYVAERLFIGHWGVLVAYASLPWVAAAGLAWRRGDRHGWARSALVCAPAVLTPTGGVLAGAVLLVTAGRRRALRAAGLLAVLNLPWLVPALAHPGRPDPDPAGVAAFAVRAEGAGGPLLSVLGTGGIWNADVVPASRAGSLVPVVTLLLAVAAAGGLRPLARRWGRRPVTGLVGLAAAGLLLALLGALPFAGPALRWATEHVPGFGLLRDGQKWTAWWALLLAVAVAAAADRVAARLAGPSGRALLAGRAVLAGRALLAGLALLPVALLPDLAWGGAGRLRPVAYPDDWAAVRVAVERSGAPGDVLTLPLSTYRSFAWNANRTQLDPAPRLLPRDTVTADDLPVGGTVVRGEDPRVVRVRQAIAGGTPLGAEGIGWVLVEHGTPGPPVPPGLLAGLAPVHAGEWLSLYRLPGPVAATPPGPPAALVLTADGLAAALLVVALFTAFRRFAGTPSSPGRRTPALAVTETENP